MIHKNELKGNLKGAGQGRERVREGYSRAVGYGREERQPGKHRLSAVILKARLMWVRNSQGKAARTEYNRSVCALEQATRVISHMLDPRFAPLDRPRGPHILRSHSQRGQARGGSIAPRRRSSKGGKAYGRTIVSGDERRAMRRRGGSWLGAEAYRGPRPSERWRWRWRAVVGPLTGGRDPQARGLDHDQERVRGRQAAGRAGRGRVNRSGERKALRHAVELQTPLPDPPRARLWMHPMQKRMAMLRFA